MTNLSVVIVSWCQAVLRSCKGHKGGRDRWEEYEIKSSNDIKMCASQHLLWLCVTDSNPKSRCQGSGNPLFSNPTITGAAILEQHPHTTKCFKAARSQSISGLPIPLSWQQNKRIPVSHARYRYIIYGITSRGIMPAVDISGHHRGITLTMAEHPAKLKPTENIENHFRHQRSESN